MAALPSHSQTLAQQAVAYPTRCQPELIEPSRQAMLTSLVARARAWSAPGQLLDVGCGGGHLLAAARAEGWRPIGTDLSLEACRVAAETAPVVHGSAEALPFGAGTLDAVTLVNVLDHTARPGAVIDEAARVLRSGGLLIVPVPNGAFHRRWSRALGHLGPLVRWRSWDTYPILHLFSFGPGALRRLVEARGFEVLSVVNSDLAGPAPSRALASTAARAVHALTGGRWVLGPSIELYARRRAAP